MKNILLKIILFVLLLGGLFYLNLYVFRSDYPLVWLISLPITVCLLIIFPYNKYFKIKNQ